MPDSVRSHPRRAAPARSKAPERDDAFVQSLARGLAVIRTLSSSEPLTLTEVADALGLTRASARRFLLTLARLGYVREVEGRFALTPRVMELGYAYLSSLTLPDVAQPHLEDLSRQVNESSSVSILDGHEIVYVARVPTRRIMSVTISVGTRFPAYATSMGRVLLAGQDPGAVEAHLATTDLNKLTPKTITSISRLTTEIGRVRRQGFALVDQELELGLRSISAPIRDSAGGVPAAVNVSVQASRLTIAEMRRVLLPALRHAAAAIERDLHPGSGAAPRAGS